jgi:DNA-binding IclR family transcriptional regulator
MRKPRQKSSDPAPGVRHVDGSETKPGSVNSTADRAIDILLLFSEDRPVWTTAEIATHFDMPRSTIYRYLGSLRSYSLIVEDNAGGYRLGPKIFPLAQAARAGTSILNVAEPFLEELNRTFGEAVTLYERIGHESIPLLRMESRHSVKMMYSRGQILPWPAAASSKALLAFAPPNEQEAIFRLLVPVRYTATTTGARGRSPRHCRAYIHPRRRTLLRHNERPAVSDHNGENSADDRNSPQDGLGHHRESQEN